MARAQIIVEFIIALSIALVIGLLYLAVTGNLLASTIEEHRTAALNQLGYTLQDELILASTMSDGYSRNITIPLSADTFVYTMTNDQNSITLQSGSITITYPTPTFIGSLHVGLNTIKKTGTIRVS